MMSDYTMKSIKANHAGDMAVRKAVLSGAVAKSDKARLALVFVAARQAAMNEGK